MSSIRLFTDDTYRGEGVSAGLARGLLAAFDGCNVTREGMGIGVPVLKSAEDTFFPGTGSTEIIDEGRVLKTFLLDTRFTWTFLAHPSDCMGRIKHRLGDVYLKFRSPALQRLSLQFGTFLRRHFRVMPRLVKTEPLAEARFVYTLQETGVSVTAAIKSLNAPLPKVYILNELGADFLDTAIDGKRQVQLPSGWQRLSGRTPSPALCNREREVHWCVDSFQTVAETPVRLFWGREKARYLCWAGFEFELDCEPDAPSTVAFDYTLNFATKVGR